MRRLAESRLYGVPRIIEKIHDGSPSEARILVFVGVRVRYQKEPAQLPRPFALSCLLAWVRLSILGVKAALRDLNHQKINRRTNAERMLVASNNEPRFDVTEFAADETAFS
jgi:hypothetical protein